MPRGSNPGERRGDDQRGATSPLSEAPPEPAPRHRSSPYNEEIATEICKLVADGIPLGQIWQNRSEPSAAAAGKGMRAHIKLRVATRKWLLANLPKR